MQNPLVFIIIVNWNCFKDTSECLESLKKLQYPKAKIVVVDNGSANAEAQKLKQKYPYVNLIKNAKNEGYVIANNQGIRLALKKGAKYLLLLNNDTVVRADFLGKLVGYAEAHSFDGILTPKILYFRSNKIWAMGGKLSVLTSIPRMIGQGKASSSYGKIISCDYASGCALFIPSKTIRNIGLLNDVYFAYYEDTDLSYRAKAAGKEIKVIPQSVIWHKVSRSTQQNNLKKIGEIQSYLQARNGLIFAKLNLKGFGKAIYIANQYLTKPLLYLIFKLQDKKAALAYLKGLWDGTKFLLKANG